MSELRLALLIAGIIAIVSLYVWELLKRRRRRRDRKPMFDAGVEAPGFRISPRGETEPGSAVPANPGDATGPVDRTNPNIDGSGKGAAADTPVPAAFDLHRPQSDEVLVLHVLAMSGQTFRGDDIVSAAGKAGLHHGAMSVFHCYGDARQQAPDILFSLVNMFEPGTLPLEEMENFRTGGLSLFMRPSQTGDNAAIFERMLGAGRSLADTLHGELCGPERRRMDDSQLAALRAKAAGFH